jgi:hypothetical protein
MSVPPAFPPFDLARLLSTVFDPIAGCRVCVLIDLDDPTHLRDFAYLRRPDIKIQRKAYEVFYKGLHDGGVMAQLGLSGGEMYAYRITGGSNLDLPAEAYDIHGHRLSLETDILARHDLVLCISTYSATAPLTAFAKKLGFRGATLHGVNDAVLATGLSVDYREVSRQAEKLRRGLTRAQAVEIDFTCLGRSSTLRLDLAGQEAQKSHGLCHGRQPDVANLPAGEVYFVPVNAEGAFPLKHEDGSLTLNHVRGGRVVGVDLLAGLAATRDHHWGRMKDDPAAGAIGELGFGTQELPFVDADIQDEKTLGTVHIATGRSDHLGGHLTPDKFTHAGNATHEDLLFHPRKTPEIDLVQVRLIKDGRTEVVIEHYQPTAFLRGLLAAPD